MKYNLLLSTAIIIIIQINVCFIGIIVTGLFLVVVITLQHDLENEEDLIVISETGEEEQIVAVETVDEVMAVKSYDLSLASGAGLLAGTRMVTGHCCL